MLFTAADYETLTAEGRMFHVESAFAPGAVRDAATDRTESAGKLACVCCGRPTKPSGLWILCVNGSHYHVANPAEEAVFEDRDGGFMGLYPIGPDCAKKLVKLGVPSGWIANM